MDAKGQYRSLAEPWADTGTGRLTIAALGGLADVEARYDPRPHRRAPQPRAEARPAHGPTVKIDAAQKAEARRRAQGATLAELARSYHVCKSTISKLTG